MRPQRSIVLAKQKVFSYKESDEDDSANLPDNKDSDYSNKNEEEDINNEESSFSNSVSEDDSQESNDSNIKKKNISQLEESEKDGNQISMDDDLFCSEDCNQYQKSNDTTKKVHIIDQDNKENEQEINYSKIPNDIKHLNKLNEKISQKLKFYQSKFFEEQHQLKSQEKKIIPDDCIPICGDINRYKFDLLAQTQLKFGERLFDVIMMDPPWQLASAAPSRGVAIAYSSLTDEQIQRMPLQKLSNNGFIFIWAINAKYRTALIMMEKWGYTLVDEITWVKKTVNGKVAPGHGFYLQHAKESCLIGVKGDVSKIARNNVASDVIFSERRGQSQKPDELYQYISELVPNGFYLEIFARRNNLSSGWVSFGNEI